MGTRTPREEVLILVFREDMLGVSTMTPLKWPTRVLILVFREDMLGVILLVLNLLTKQVLILVFREDMLGGCVRKYE